MTAWEEYLEAIGALAAVRHDASRSVAQQEGAVQNARADLHRAHQRIALQRNRIASAATDAGRVAPSLTPTEMDRRAAAMLVPPGTIDPTPSICAALGSAWSTLDAADAALTTLSGAEPTGPLAQWPPRLRVAVPYIWYAVLAGIVLLIVNGFAGGTAQGGDTGLFVGVTVPAGAWVLGFISAGLVFGPGRDGRRRRGGLAGAAICAVPLLLGLLLSMF